MSWTDKCFAWTDEDDDGVEVCGPCAKLVYITMEDSPDKPASHHYSNEEENK